MIMNFAVHLDLGCSNETGIPEEAERYFETAVTVLREYIGDKYGGIPPVGHDHSRHPMIAPLYSTLKISLCMMDIFNLSTNLFTNVLALVLQVYRRENLYNRSPTQVIISGFFTLNIILSLVKAPILYYRISKSGDYSWLSCHLHYFAMGYSRLMVPWIFVAIAVNGYLQLVRKRRYWITVASIFILLLIFCAFLIPEALTAEETVKSPIGHIKSISGTLEALWYDEEEPEEEITVIRHSQCILNYQVHLISNIFCTYILPLFIVSTISCKIWRKFYKNADSFDQNKGKYLLFVWIQPFLIILSFLFNLNYYRWYDEQVNYDVILSEIVDFLPYFGFMFYWLPVILVAVNLHEIESQRNRVKVSTSTQAVELSSRPAVTISQPDDVHRRARTYSINRF